MAIGLIGIFVSLALLITLAYRGVSIIIAAPIAALVAMITSGMPLLATYTDIFMPAMAGFVGSYFPIFLTGAIFGALMLFSGYATDLANTITRWLGPARAVFATVLTSALMTYGGISVFVAVFVMFPLARELFRVADIPRRLIPATIALGILTFTMTAIPGAPQVQNIIPGQFFQTSTFAAPALGIVGGTLVFLVGMFWLEFRKKQLMRAGESFNDITTLETKYGRGADLGLTADNAPNGHSNSEASSEATATTTATSAVKAPVTTRKEIDYGDEDLPVAATTTQAPLAPTNHFFPFIPLLLVFIVNFSATQLVLPNLDWSVLEDDAFGGITLSDRSATWAVILALLAAIISIVLLNIRRAKELWQAFVDGTKNSLQPIFNTASEVGYGAVIASLAAFTIVRDGIFGISSNALVTSAVSTSVISGVTGSASGGMTIALNAFGEDLRNMAVDQGISMEVMHRITSMASGGLDSMPHNGAVITLLMVCGLSHRESYKDVFMITLVIPALVTAALIGGILLIG
ncbi:MAG: GntP family permease [Micrococcaceae bacterium]|nr:GntP family permease [Micrococcaceae bacterium]